MNDNKKISLPSRPNPTFSSISEFLLGPVIGDGGFAKVRRVTHRISKAQFAAKIIHLSAMGLGDIENIEKELEIHASLDSPYIVKLIDFFEEAKVVYLIMELVSKGNLYQYMFKRFPLPVADALRFWVGTVRAIDYLHSNAIYMRDIKSENVLIGADLGIKLCDFGWASRMSDFEYRRLQGGTYIYMSPESLRGELQGFESDLWSLGVLLYELIHYREPFKIGRSSKEQLEIIRDSKIEFKEGLDRPIREMVLMLMREKKEERPSVQEILAMDWVQQLGEELDSQGITAFY